jgi:hypothetical protein
VLTTYNSQEKGPPRNVIFAQPGRPFFLVSSTDNYLE